MSHYAKKDSCNMGLDLSAILSSAVQSGVSSAEAAGASTLIKDPTFQQLASSGTQNAAASTLATDILQYKWWLLGGGAAIVGLLFLNLLKKR
jgi:hypothetical protein